MHIHLYVKYAHLFHDFVAKQFHQNEFRIK